MEMNEASGAVIGAAIEVHKTLGPGLLESVYEQCLCRELAIRDVPFMRQYPIPVRYKGVLLEAGYRLDLIVANIVIVEIKAVSEVSSVDQAQLLTYLRLSGLPLGLLLNFNVALMREGIHRVAGPSATKLLPADSTHHDSP